MTTWTDAEVDPEATIHAAVLAAIRADGCELPVLPEVALELLELTSDIDCEPADIVGLFRRDQSLTGHLLKTVNSARYSCGQTVTSIQQAVALLGLLQVREIVLVISCQSKIFNVRTFEADVRQSFQKSLATAAFAQEIARLRRLNVEDSFLCGLLHDVGRPMLLQALSDQRVASGTNWTDAEVRSAAAEHGVTMACRLVLSWKLSERIAETIRYQATPMEAPHTELSAAMLNLAMDLADRALADDCNDLWKCSHPMAEVLTLYPEDMDSIVQKGAGIIDWARSSS